MKKDERIIKNVLLAIIVILSSNYNTIGQCPIEDELIFTKQSTLDSFIVSYPNCTDLNIVNISGEIINLGGLKVVK